MDISYSDLKAYWTCPLKFKHRVTGTPVPPGREKRSFIGHLLMRVAEAFYKDEWWRHPATIYAQARAALVPLGYEITKQYQIDWAPQEFEAWIDLARMAVISMIDTVKTERLLGIRNLTEVEATIKVGEHTVHGRFDFLIISKDWEVTLLDGKGGSRSYSDLDQLRLYTTMVPGLVGKPANRVGFWYFQHGEVVWKKITDKDRAKVLDKTRSALSGICSKSFLASPSPKCRLCDWKHLCPEGQAYLVAKAGDDSIDLPVGQGEVSL